MALPVIFGFLPILDASIILILPAILLSMWAQSRIQSTYRQYSQIRNQRNLTGAQVARFVLDNAGLKNVPVEPVKGQLTDHYDPRGKVLRLSEGVYGSNSIAALGIATHEVGHAIQDATSYGPMRLRGAIVPLAAIGGNLSLILIMVGLGMGGNSGLVRIGTILFLFTVLFQVVTLPVEFDASRRALRYLDTGILTKQEVGAASKVLNAAAWTYVAAAVTAILNFVRLLIIGRRRN